MSFKFVDGGVCAAKGFKASGIWCGIRANRTKRDLALIVSEAPCAAAAIYTQNKVKGAPILVTQEHLENGTAQAVLCNSGNANTCNADGEFIAHAMCESAAMPSLVSALRADGGTEAAEAIMTTDTLRKEVAVSFDLEGRVCTVGGIAKGSGMIHPNMATMLCFVTSDTAISPEMLRKACKVVADETFNMISVDGDTSTNDMMSVMANGLAGNDRIESENAGYFKFVQALTMVCRQLAKLIAADGEGATKLLECTVLGAPDKETAKKVAKSVVCSNLLKAAMFGADANWGRVLCAIGYTDADFDISRIAVEFSSKAGTVQVCEGGAGVAFSEEAAKQVLLESEIHIEIDMDQGVGQATAWGCDLTYDYVKINGDYRT